MSALVANTEPSPSGSHAQWTGLGQTGVPKPEYPRPDRDRSDRWLSLNGTWDFLSEDGPAQITVPFAWETTASGIGRTWLEHARYERDLIIPPDWTGARAILCFGAIHHHCTVKLDGQLLGEHIGGYTPFEFDITDRLCPGTSARLVIEVEAPADKRAIPHGKQRSIPRDDYDGVSFTPTSGIWQTVWLEARGRTYPADVTVRGDSLTSFELSGNLVGDNPSEAPLQARIIDGSSTGEELILLPDSSGRFTGRLPVAEPRLWSPADPHLYRIELVTGAGAQTDRVIVTTGLRRIETAGEQILLNGQRIYLRGVLDQGYWPDTGLTAPDDSALLRDLEIARDHGHNLVRKHIKLEEPRWLHHADQMGMLVWAEPPGPSRYTPESATAFEAQLAPMVERDVNHPSIIIWGLYNEEWGLDWDISGSPERAAAAAHAYDTLKALDPTRPVVENSGWAHVRTDLVDWHHYDEDPAAWASTIADLAAGTREDFPVKLGPDFIVDKSFYGSPHHPRQGVPVLNSEYGAGFTSLERGWHLRWQTQEIRRHSRYVGYVYTELTDVEHELAGLVDADRRPKDRGNLDPLDVNTETVLIMDLVPAHAGADIPVPHEPLDLSVRISHHGSKPLRGQIRAAWVSSGRPFPPRLPTSIAETLPVTAEPWVTTPPATLTIPSVDVSARLLLWFIDEFGAVRARTILDAGLIEPPNRRGARPA